MHFGAYLRCTWDSSRGLHTVTQHRDSTQHPEPTTAPNLLILLDSVTSAACASGAPDSRRLQYSQHARLAYLAWRP